MVKSKIVYIIIVLLAISITTGCQNNNDNEYTVTFNANGGKFKDSSTVKQMKWSPASSRDNIICADGNDFAIVCGNLPGQHGYFFVDWKSNQDGTGFSYSYSSLPHADVTFFAQWGPESEGYIVSFDTMGSSPVQTITGIMPNTSVPLPNTTDMIRDGYAFLGWVEKNDGQIWRSLHVSSIEVTHYPIQTIELAAIWQKQRSVGSICTVNFNPDGGILEDPSFLSKQIICGSILQFPYAFADNSSLSGWYPSETYVEFIYPGSYPIFDDITFYARWK